MSQVRHSILNGSRFIAEKWPFVQLTARILCSSASCRLWPVCFRRVDQENDMKVLLAATFGLVLGTFAVDAIAQSGNYSRSRDEGRSASSSQQSSHGRSERSGRGGGDGRVSAPTSSYSQSDGGRSQRGDRQGRGGRGEQPVAQTPNYNANSGRGHDGRGRGNPSGGVSNYSGGHDRGRGNHGSQSYSDNRGRGDDRRGNWDRNRHNYTAQHDNNRHRSSGLSGRDYNRPHHGYNQSGYRPDRRDYRHDRRHWNHPDWRRSWNHGWAGHRYRAPSRYYYPRGYSVRSWSIGYRLPSVFFAPSYHISYGHYGLAPPPYGCTWIRVDRDVMLIDLETGEIVDILYGFYYY